MSSASSGNSENDASNIIPASADDELGTVAANISMDIGVGAESQPTVSWLFDESPKPYTIDFGPPPDLIRDFDYVDDSGDEDYDNISYDYDYDDDFDEEDDYFNDGDEFGELLGMEDLLYMDAAIKKGVFNGEDYESMDSLTTVLNKTVGVEDMRKYKRYEKILAKLAEDQREGILCDVILEVDGQDFPIHKNVLKASSSYFEAMFTGKFNEREEKRIKIGSVTKEDFQVMVDFAYGTPIKLELDDYEKIYMMAEMFCMDDLIEECKKQLEKKWNSYSLSNQGELPLDDTAKILELGESMEMKSFCDNVVKDLMKRLKAYPNHRDILMKMSPTVLLPLLKCSTKYNLKKETEKIHFLVEWFRIKPEDRLVCLKDILGLLNLQLVDYELFESFRNGVENLITIHFTAEEIDEIKKDFQKIKDSFASNKVNFNIEVLLFFQEPLRGDIRYYHEDSAGNGSWDCHNFKIETEIHQCVFVEQNNHLVLLGRDSLYIFNSKKPEKVLHPKKASILKRFEEGFVACAQRTQIIIAGRSNYRKRTNTALTVNAFQYYKAKPVLIPLFHFNLDNYLFVKQPTAISVVGETFYITAWDPHSRSTSGLLLVHEHKLSQTYPYEGLHHSSLRTIVYANNRVILHYENEKVFLIDQHDSSFSGISIKLDHKDHRARSVAKTKIFEEIENKDQEWIGSVMGTLVGSCRVKKSLALLMAQADQLLLFSMENLEKFEFLKSLPTFPRSAKELQLDDCVFFLRPSA